MKTGKSIFPMGPSVQPWMGLGPVWHRQMADYNKAKELFGDIDHAWFLDMGLTSPGEFTSKLYYTEDETELPDGAARVREPAFPRF